MYCTDFSVCRDWKLTDGSPGDPGEMLIPTACGHFSRTNNITVITGLLAADHNTLLLVSGYHALSGSSTPRARNSAGRSSACGQEFPPTPEPRPGHHQCHRRPGVKVASASPPNGTVNEHPQELLGVTVKGSCSAAVWRLAKP